MNMPPECKFKGGYRPCSTIDMYTVLNKSKGTVETVCLRHIHDHLLRGSLDTYTISPAKDYSIHGGHDLPAKRKDT